ncbi:unnamed protein product [Parnassius apollo]|uniref:(apollo) hypothetical protein n=1 Tax=Parnassius apollo TaxID=110799 RepID=A0A8S3Y4J4_PARAO|nr:unnamed protein product [Parnassius apollo]
MTTTLHKILTHGQNIIEHLTLPVRLLSEHAAESRNKYDREHHSRKDSRRHTTEDLFHRALVSSDPVVSNTRLSRRHRNIKHMSLPTAVIEMLKPFKFNDDENLVKNNSDSMECNETDESEFTSILTNKNEVFLAKDEN